MNTADQTLTEAAARRAQLEEKWAKTSANTRKKRHEYATSVAELTDVAEDLADAIAAHQTALAAARL